MKKILSAILFILAIFASSGCGGGTPVTPPDNPGDGRVGNYTLLYNDKICRWEDSSFPLKVYMDPAADMGGYGSILYASAVKGIDMWNGVIDGIPVVFKHETNFDKADIVGRWEWMKLDGYTLAKDYGTYIKIRKYAINEDIMNPDTVRLMVAHELGHVLGLNLSNVSGDLMFSRVYPEKTTITKRDRDMINWLYSQENYIPIRAY